MSNTPEDLDDLEPEAEQPKRNFRRELEERATVAEQKALRLERENAIYKAGLTDLTDRQISVLASQIEGDPTPDQVKTLAAELGWVKDDQPKDDVPAEERNVLDQVNAATSGASSTGVDPFAVLEGVESEEDFWKEARANGLTTS